MKSLFSIILAGVFISSSPAISSAKELFVDFQSGSDSNSGLSKNDPWKHAPGDPNAESEASDYDLEGGDIVLFKGGIEYLGNIVIAEDGEPGKPIIYRGNGWGDNPAIISGAKSLKGQISKCNSQQACYGNPNWEKLYLYSIEEDLDPLAPLYLSGKRLWLARSPNQADPFWFDDIKQYSVLGKKDSSIEMTSSYLRMDPDELNGTAEDWKTAVIAIWMRPNVVILRNVVRYDRSTGTIFFEAVKNKPYTKRDSYYSLFNRSIDLDIPGEYIVDKQSKTILFWPESQNKAEDFQFRYNALANGFVLDGKSNITIEGFKITRFYGGAGAWKSGAGITNSKKTSENITIRNNRIEDLRSVEGVGAIQLHHMRNTLVENNVISNDQKNSGVRVAYSKDVTINNNVIDRIGRTGIRVIDNENILVSNNKLSNIKGGHGNGMSVYLRNKNILIASNTIESTPSAFTFHGGKPGEAENLWIFNNIFLGRTNSWGSSFPSVVFLHNLIYNPDTPKKSLQISGKEKDLTIKNNILGGFLVKPLPLDWKMSSNIYTNLSFTQSRKYKWRLEPDSDVDQGLGGNFDDGVANISAFKRPAGANIYDILPTEIFKNFDFSPWRKDQPIGPNLIPSR